MHNTVMDFVKRVLTQSVVEGKDVLEIGSYNVNGTVRPDVEAHRPLRYLATDMRKGPGVDLIANVCDLTGRLVFADEQSESVHFSPESKDIVICCEVLEHVENWRMAIYQMKEVLKPGGLLVLTTRSQGFPLHEYPGDYWRFELSDMLKIFSDFKIEHLERDTLVPGVFVSARKPLVAQLEQIEVYSMPGGT